MRGICGPAETPITAPARRFGARCVPRWIMTEIRVSEHTEQPTAVLREQVAMSELPEFFQRAFEEVMAAVQAQNIPCVGPPFGKYYGMPGETVDLEAGFPVAAAVAPTGDVVPSTLPGGPVVEAVHVGPYDTLEQTYGELESWMEEQDLRGADVMWESYLSDPEAEPDPATWRTLICVPVATGG
jgi:effector-binding domain-containing protein